MKTNDLNRIVLSLLLLGAMSCSEAAGNYSSFKTVSYYNEESFPRQLSLVDMDTLDVDCMGVLDVAVRGDFILLSTTVDSALVKAFRKDNLAPAGSFLRLGRGPGEVLSPLFFDSCQISEDLSGDSFVYDSQSSKLLAFNALESIESDSFKFEEYDLRSFQGREAFHVGPDEFFYRRWNANGSGLERHWVKADSGMVVPALDVLNSVCIGNWNTSFSFNLVGSIIAQKPGDRVFVEAGTYLNSINVYSLDGDVAQTICVGRRLDRVNDLEKMDIFTLPPQFGTVRAYRAGFCCHYLPQNQIMGFDWNCSPLFVLDLPGSITSFDFDMDGNTLYLVDSETELLSRIKLPSLWL